MRNFGKTRKNRLSIIGDHHSDPSIEPGNNLRMPRALNRIRSMETIDEGYFKAVLSDLLQLMLQKDGMTTVTPADYENRHGDFLDRATADLESLYQQLFRHRATHFIQQIEQALHRLENGCFGVCDECGDEIPMDRLLVMPDTPYCIACKMELERRERVKQVAAYQ